MHNFTRLLFKRSGITLILALCFQYANAQSSHLLVVDSPAGVAGTYEIEAATFGATNCDYDTLTGNFILVEDEQGGTEACGSVQNDLSGGIGIIDRGNCNFTTKALSAQNAGAAWVIVCNNVSDPIFAMGGTDDSGEITIPAFMLSQEDCNRIRVEIGNTVSARAFLNPGEDVVVWGNQPGEGDFDGGLNGWTSRTLNCGGAASDATTWTWGANGDAPNGACGGGTVTSTTACNGAAIFESDFIDSNGGSCGVDVAVGPCPAPHIGELISPTIDLSGSSAPAFSLKFQQFTRQFQSAYYVGWSADNGVTWDSIEINTAIQTNCFNEDIDLENLDCYPEGEEAPGTFVRVPLVGVTNADQLRVKFRYEANYYYWIVDDVQIVEQEANNLRVNSNFFAIPNNFITPLDQVEPTYFLADIENIGAAEQINVNLNMTITNTEGDEVFNDNLDYGSVAGNTLVENEPFLNSFTPTQEGAYTGVYTISAEATDVDQSNNTQTFNFLVGDTTLAKEFGATRFIAPAASNWDQNEPRQWGYGNFFHIVNGSGKFVRSVGFGIGNANELVGQFLIINLYEWTDNNADGAVDREERVNVGFTTYLVNGDEAPSDIITVVFPDLEVDDPIELKDDTDYILMVEYFPESTDDPDLVLVGSEDFDYGAQVFVTALQGTPRYASILGIAGDLGQASFSTVGFGFDIVPIVRLHIGDQPTVSTRNLPSLNDQIAVFPNPADKLISVQLGLEETAENGTLTIIDAAGKTIVSKRVANVRNDTFEFNTSTLGNGIYMMQLLTENGMGTKRFMVSH